MPSDYDNSDSGDLPSSCLPPTFICMSANVGEHQAHHTLSSIAPRKRSRQESGCDIDSGLGDSEGGSSGSGSGLSETGETGDGRQGGSQKRARSEGHGDPEVSRDADSWNLDAESRSTSSQAHAPVTVSTSSTRLSSGFPTTTRYNSGEPNLGSSEESFIPLPPISSSSDVRRDPPDYGDSSGLPVDHTVREDIARSMAFDEQIDVLRRTPISIPSSPVRRDHHSTVDPHAAIEPGPSPSSETSFDSIGELEVSGSEPHVNEVDRSNSSGRLHTLADTASRHSRLLHASANHMTPILPPILPPLPAEAAPATSNDTSLSMLPRLRVLRRHEQPRNFPRLGTRISSPDVEQEDRDQTLSGYMENFGSTDEALRSSGGTGQFSSSIALPPSPTSGVRQTNPSSSYHVPNRNRSSFTRRDLLHDMHSPFDPFELDERSFPELARDSEVRSLDFRVPTTRRLRRPPTPTSHTSVERPFTLHMDSHQSDQDDHDMTDVTVQDHLVGPGRGTFNASGSRDVTPGTAPRTHGRLDRLPDFWTGIFDETDSERDGSSRRPISLFDDSRRPASDPEWGPQFRNSRPVYDTFRDDLRRRPSAWDSPRRASVQSENDNASHTTSSSPSSMSSYGRSTSRSLLDPTLSFGSGSSTFHSRSSLASASGQESETTNRSRRRLRTSLGSWFDERSLEEEDPVGLNRFAPGNERRRGEGLATLSSFFSSTETSRNEERPSLPRSPSRHISHLRHAQLDTNRHFGSRAPVADRDPPSRSAYESERATAASRVRSPDSWGNLSVTPDLPDFYPGPSMQRDFVSSSATTPNSAPPITHDLHYPFPPASSGFTELPSPVASRFRLRRPAAQNLNNASADSDRTVDSMEDIIPESNAREINTISPSFRQQRSPSPFASNRRPFSHIEPPPRPVEPRLTSWDVGPRASVRAPTIPHSPSSSFISPSRQDSDPAEVADPAPDPLSRPQRPISLSYRNIFNWTGATEPSEQSLAPRRATSSVEGNERRFPHVATTPLEQPQNQPSEWPLSTSNRQETGTHRVETFNELVRRRAARAEAQARANARPASPETTLRHTYRLPRPSFLRDDEDSTLRRDRLPRIERRNSAALPGRASTGGSSLLEVSRRERLDRQRAAFLLERSISSRNFGDRPINRQEWERYYDNLLAPASSVRSQLNNVGERNGNAGTSVRTRMLERSSRQALLSTPVESFDAENAQEDEGTRERQQLHDAIGRRARDDELSTRRSLTNTDRTRHINSRDPMSIETTRNLQRRLRESEAEVGRALHALDQWGELEGSGDREFDPTQSRMHRFGETLRRRRVPPPFSFADTISADQDHAPGFGSSSAVRTGRRSPSPTTAATRLQARQARFARVQGRFRELGADFFGEPRSRSTYASRLDLLGGSRFASRYIARNLGDYMRDEDFDASYENLVRLAAAVGEAKPRGTPAHLIAAMPTGFYKDFATPGCDSRCPICLDDYKDLDPVLRISDCDHWFHKECLEQWLSGENSCPICRRRIRGAQEEPPHDAPGPSGSRRDDDSDEDRPESGPGGSGRTGSPGLTLEELSSYAAAW